MPLAQVKDRIVNVHWRKKSDGRAWYWYLKHQIPYHFSLYGVWMVLPNYPMVVILLADKRSFPGAPVEPVGFHSLEAAVRNGFPCMMNYFSQDYPGHAGGLYSHLTRGHYGLLGGKGGVHANTVLGSPMTCEPRWERKIAFAKGIYPDIWTLVGMDRPPLRDPSQPWDMFSNPYWPTAEAAEQCARTFETMFMNATNAFNAKLWESHGKSKLVSFKEPPIWEFKVPWVNWVDVGLNAALTFNAGINGAVLGNFPILGIIYPFAYEIAVDQLSDEWDTQFFPPRKKRK